MKPIYFPFTFISEPVLDALSACFGKVVVYQSSKANIPEKMKEWDKRGRIDIRVPVEGDEEKIEKIVQDFKTWADLHQGSELSILKTQTGKIPFFNDNATSQITLDIKRQDLEKPSQEKPERLLNARLFLQIAQEHDLLEDVLRRDLSSFEAMEQNLVKDLTGDMDSSPMDIEPYPSIETRDTGHYMTKERIEAWSRIMQHDHQHTDLFVTSSRSVIEHLLDDAPEAEILTAIDDIPSLENEVEKKEKWQNHLMNLLETTIMDASSASTKATTPPPVAMGKDRKRTLTFYIIPGLSPHQFFSRYIESTGGRLQGKKLTESVKNTLLGWYDM